MIHRSRQALLPILAGAILSSVADAEDAIKDSPTKPLSHLVESVERLRTKDIPQAYFWLQSPQLPNSTIFFPDTRGGAYILIGLVMKLPKEADAKKALAELSKTWPKSELPILDVKNNRLLYYSDEAWSHLEATLRPWATRAEEVKDLALVNQWNIAENDLIIRIPKENTADFYAALIEAWRTSKDDFRCFAGWN